MGLQGDLHVFPQFTPCWQLAHHTHISKHSDHHTHILTTIHTFPNTPGVRGRKEVRTTSGAYSFSGPPEVTDLSMG